MLTSACHPIIEAFILQYGAILMGDQSYHFTLDSFGRTRLFYAAEKGDLEEVKRIIFGLAGTGISCQRLSLISIIDNGGHTAADIAKQSGHKEISDLLRSEFVRMEYYE